ncbi:hypothetical protein [Paenibacillus ferrarius]|uniref:hypothetical protein n=1 Tax=Paenibacillus ferrarius TaxID=1469647 RepID=UPI001301F66D|nr:hypothetical protein [Paenibacillus ferrarius]
MKYIMLTNETKEDFAARKENVSDVSAPSLFRIFPSTTFTVMDVCLGCSTFPG